MATPNPFRQESPFASASRESPFAQARRASPFPPPTPRASLFSPAPQPSPVATNPGAAIKMNQLPPNSARENLPAPAKKSKFNDSHKVIIDPKGDLYLQVSPIKSETSGSAAEHVSSGTTEFIVDSKALSRASPTFAKLLDENPAESKKSDESTTSQKWVKWVVKLPADNESAMSALLHIMHCRFDKAPTVGGGIVLSDLYQLAVLTNEYRCTSIVRPWVKSWLNHASQVISGASIPELESLSWIAWEFGDRSLFEKVTKGLILRFTLTTKLFSSETPISTLFQDTLEPTGLKDLVQSRRREAISALLSPVYEALANLLQPMNMPSRKPMCIGPLAFGGGQKHDCEAIMLGRLIQSLSAVNLWPLPPASTCQRSVLALRDDLRTVSVKGYPDARHANCDLLRNHTASIDDIIKGLTSPTPKQIVHLAAQAKVSGLTQ